MTDEQRAAQVAGLKRRIELLEAQSAKMRAAIEFTNKTLALCRDPEANPLVKMVDRARAEQMLKDAVAPPTPQGEG